jgi:putative transposase
LVRELDERLGLSALIAANVMDDRRGKNSQLPLPDLLRQSIPKPPLTLATDEQTQLRSLAGSRTLPHALVAWARLVLWSADGQSNTQIARRLRWTKATVGKWRQRFVQHRLAGLYDELRPGRPRSIDDEQIATLLKRAPSPAD